MNDKTIPSSTVLFLFRHGSTDWAVSGKHTGRTDVPLNDRGRQQAESLRSVVSQLRLSAVLSSPLSRARDTAIIAGLGDHLEVCDDLAELDYGQYEGLTTTQIQESTPGWTIWSAPCPGGESLQHAVARVSNVIEKATTIGGNVAIFAHGHILRVLATVWLGLSPADGEHFMLDTSTLSILGHEHGRPAVKAWNAPVAISELIAPYAVPLQKAT